MHRLYQRRDSLCRRAGGHAGYWNNYTNIIHHRLDLYMTEEKHRFSLNETQYSNFPDWVPTCPARRYSEFPRQSLSSVNMNLNLYSYKRPSISPTSRHPSLCLVTEQLLQSRRSSCMSRLGTPSPWQEMEECKVCKAGVGIGGTIVEEGSDNWDN